MKMPFGFGGRSGKKNTYRDLPDEEYINDEYSEDGDMEAVYSDEEYMEDEYADDEYADGEYAEEEYADGGYAEEKYADGEYADGGYAEEEYADGEYADGEYAEEEYADGGYAEEEYADGEYADGGYAEEEYADGGYADGGYAEEEYADGEYAEAESVEDEYYEDEYSKNEYEEISYEDDVSVIVPYDQDDSYEDYEYEDEDSDENVGLLPFGNVSGIVDKLITIGGAAVLLIGLIIGGIFIYSRMNTQEGDGFLNVGNQLAQIEVIGESGLLAVSDAQRAALEAAALLDEEEESNEYEEEDYNAEVTVKLSMASIEKDLKIKFVNQKTGKLVGNVPFNIQVTDPDGKETLWSDDDMDGIIYKKNLKAGKYTVSVNAFEEERYQKFELPLGEQKVEVKAEIEYKKVDVANEVKSESQVDVQKEDTKKNETEVESYLTDTVTWVESTATLVTYAEVAKENIVDPMQLVMHSGFVRLSAENTLGAVTETPTETPATVPTEAPTQAPTTVPTEAPTEAPTEVPTAAPTEAPTQAPTTAPTTAPTETPTTAPTESPNATATPSPSPSVSPSPSPTPTPTPSPSPTPSPTPTPTATATPKPMVITLDRKTATVYMEEPLALNVVKVENEMSGAKITASSSNTNVATVAVDGKKITINGVAPGEATITVDCSATVQVSVSEGDSTKTETKTYKASPVTCTVVVKSNPKKDTTTVLKDNQGREVYVLDNNTYRAAHYADYYTFSKFYVKGSPKYTGWQTLNGKRYFYDASGKKVTGEQVIQGVKYNFASDGSLVTGSGTLGIDVSKWNGNIDWTAVKNSGVSYVIIRCGYRGSSQGALIKDSKFETNINGAINAGLKVGVYFFSQAIDKNEAVEEASMVLEYVKNYKISYPIFLDVEASGGRADSISVATRTEVCKAFCETIQSYGYTAGIYANKNWFTEKINTSELSGKYKIWLAQYAAEPTYTGRYDIWQYKSTGKINGISGDVDMNLSYLGY